MYLSILLGYQVMLALTEEDKLAKDMSENNYKQQFHHHLDYYTVP